MGNRDDATTRIRALNDALRQSGLGGRTMVTAGVNALAARDRQAVLNKVARFTSFTQANDAYGEHDFGKVAHNGQVVFWKIDYYDHLMQAGSEDPADPAQTLRVLTIMLAEEY